MNSTLSIISGLFILFYKLLFYYIQYKIFRHFLVSCKYVTGREPERITIHYYVTPMKYQRNFRREFLLWLHNNLLIAPFAAKNYLSEIRWITPGQ